MASIGFVGVLIGIATGVASLLPKDVAAAVELARLDLQPMRLSEYEARAATVTKNGDRKESSLVPFVLAKQIADDPTAPDDNAPDDNAPDGNAPDDNAPDDNAPDDNAPDDNAPDDNAPDDNAPDDNAPDDNAPDDSAAPDDGSRGTRDLGVRQIDDVEDQLKLERGGTRAVDQALRLMEQAADEADLAHCGATEANETCAVLPLLSEIVDPNGAAATPAEAARRVLSILTSARSIRTPSGTEVLGVTVDFDLTLTGYGAEDVRVAWSMYRPDGRPLPKSWLREVTVLRIPVGGDDAEQVSGRFWVPLPEAEAKYKIKITVYDHEGVPRGHVRTKGFRGPSGGT